MDKTIFLKEWRCASNPYRRLMWFFIIIFAFMTFIMWKTTQSPELFAKYPHSQIMAYTSGAVTLFLIGLKIFRTSHLKQVRFTPNVIYVERKKIDLRYLESIYYVRDIRGRHNALMAIEFGMIFLPNPVINEDVHFFMEFGKSIFSNMEHYDYESRFIDTLLDWADERREQRPLR